MKLCTILPKVGCGCLLWKKWLALDVQTRKTSSDQFPVANFCTDEVQDFERNWEVKAEKVFPRFKNSSQRIGKPDINSLFRQVVYRIECPVVFFSLWKGS